MELLQGLILAFTWILWPLRQLLCLTVQLPGLLRVISGNETNNRQQQIDTSIRHSLQADTHTKQQQMDAPIRHGLEALQKFAEANSSRNSSNTSPTDLNVGAEVCVASTAGRFPVDVLDIQFRREGMISFVEIAGSIAELIYTDADGGEGEVELEVRAVCPSDEQLQFARG